MGEAKHKVSNGLEMNDVNTISKKPLDESEVAQLQNITLLFFAYRDFIEDADRELSRIGFGRAHHRVLFFVARKPGLNVAELLAILKITKQSLARVLKDMISKGYIHQQPGDEDRRQRLLFPTAKGRVLILLLSKLQSKRISEALSSSQIEDKQSISTFLYHMMESVERETLDSIIGSA